MGDMLPARCGIGLSSACALAVVLAQVCSSHRQSTTPFSATLSGTRRHPHRVPQKTELSAAEQTARMHQRATRRQTSSTLQYITDQPGANSGGAQCFTRGSGRAPMCAHRRARGRGQGDASEQPHDVDDRAVVTCVYPAGGTATSK